MCAKIKSLLYSKLKNSLVFGKCPNEEKMIRVTNFEIFEWNLHWRLNLMQTLHVWESNLKFPIHEPSKHKISMFIWTYLQNDRIDPLIKSK